MSTYTLNPDGSVTIPLRGDREPVTIPEPSVRQLAEATAWVLAVDAQMPVVPSFSKDDPESVAQVQKVLKERTVIIYSEESPYAAVVAKIATAWTGQEVTLDDLPSWSASPTTIQQMLGHWQTPLAGEAGSE